MEKQSQVWREEQERLIQTLAVVKEELSKTEQELGITEGVDRLIHVMDDGSNDAEVMQFVMRNKLRALQQFRLSEKQPYFAHLEFTPHGGKTLFAGMSVGEASAVYVGRWGVIKTPEYSLWVADWRSPIANLYYSGQIGEVSYDAPDARVEGRLSLKRMLSVENGELTGMQDTGVVGQEKFLTDALSQVTTARLREVVTTIQAEQNTVIRYEPTKPLCVQGVAGSGKTTIALHRIAWILYHLQKTISTQQLLILAPNPLFLSYISGVLPDLGVDDVRQLTFAGLCDTLMGKNMPKIWQSARLSERLEMTKAERDALDDVLKRKGALSLRSELACFMAEWEQACLPTEDFRIGNRVILTVDELKRYFLIEFRHFPLCVRMEEIRRVVSKRLKIAIDELTASLEKLVDEKLSTLLRTLPDGPERREQAKKLFDARDERLTQMKALQKSMLKSYASLWGSMDLLTVYAEFWRTMVQRNEQNRTVLDATLPVLAKKRIAAEDLPALLILAKGLYGLKRMDIRHVVIDEAQDVSPLQIKVLRELFGHDAFTLVGDLCQGIYGDEGLRSWQELSHGIFDTVPKVAQLSIAYRSTVEITEAAFAVLARHPVEGAGTAKPVLRHGQSPKLTKVEGREKCACAVKQIVQAWLCEGFSGIAVIVKTEKAAKKLQNELTGLGLSTHHISQGDNAFAGGVQVMDASVVKGLEFDCVLIADADAQTYPDERFYAKLFYVLCTRPLHRLELLCAGACTPLWCAE